MATELVLVRHGAADLSPEHAADPPLSAAGHDQARAVARLLGGETFAALYSSPLRRALDTAGCIGERVGLSPRTSDGLAEFDRHAGYTDFAALRASADPRYDAFRRGDLSSWGVDIEQFRCEALQAMSDIAASHREERVIVVTHGGVLNVYLSAVLGIPRPFFHRPANTGVSRVVVGEGDDVLVETMNEYHHLRELHA